MLSGGFLTVTLQILPLPGSMIGGITPTPPASPVVISQSPPAAPKPRQLIGWKDIVAVSVAHGGPSTEQHLRRLAIRCNKRKRWQPFWKVDDTDNSPVTCTDVELVQWLTLRRKPFGMAQLGDKPKQTKKAPRPR